jgi:hypothetical protein
VSLFEEDRRQSQGNARRKRSGRSEIYIIFSFWKGAAIHKAVLRAALCLRGPSACTVQPTR